MPCGMCAAPAFSHVAQCTETANHQVAEAAAGIDSDLGPWMLTSESKLRDSQRSVRQDSL
jgi:hypothetical protein